MILYTTDSVKKTTADSQSKVDNLTSNNSGVRFMRLQPNNEAEIMVLDKSFRSWIEQFNSKQIRTIKERLYTAYILVDESRLAFGDSVEFGILNKSLSEMEHFNVVSLLHFICLSEFEKNLTKSEIIDSK